MIKTFIKRVLPPHFRLWLRFGLFLKIRGLLYVGKRYKCSCCDGNFRKFLPKRDGFETRENVICPRCGVVERHRLLMLVLEQETNFFKAQKKVLHFSPEFSTQAKFKTFHKEGYLSADLNSILAMEHWDIQEIPYPDNHFDVIICSHVLSFVKDDTIALSELQRVLDENGYLIIQTDLHKNAQTIVHPEMSIDAMQTYSQWERLRSYGEDFFARIKDAGLDFEIIEFGKNLEPDQVKHHGINPEENIIFCRKPS